MMEISKEVGDTYKPYMTETRSNKTIAQNKELQKITEYLLSKYGVIELDNLFKILCFITNRKIEYTGFKYFMNSSCIIWAITKDLFEQLSLFEQMQTL